MNILDKLNQITTLSYSDLPIFLLCSIVYYIYRLVLSDIFILELKRIISYDPEKDKHQRFIPRFFDTVHYIISGIIGLFATLQRPYAHCFAFALNCFDFLQQNPDGFILTLFEKIYFIFFTSYYVVDLFYVHTSPEPIVIIIHHIVCLGMIFSCIALKVSVVGLSIMLLHDVVDIPLYVAKICNYCKLDLARDILFVVFAVLCTWFRIINFPIIIKHCIVIGIKDPYLPLLFRGTCVLLCIMYILHLKWEYQILNVAYKSLKGIQVHDSRSD